MLQTNSDTSSSAVSVSNGAAIPVVTLDAYDPSSTPSGNQVYARR